MKFLHLIKFIISSFFSTRVLVCFFIRSSPHFQFLHVCLVDQLCSESQPGKLLFQNFENSFWKMFFNYQKGSICSKYLKNLFGEVLQSFAKTVFQPNTKREKLSKCLRFVLDHKLQKSSFLS